MTMTLRCEIFPADLDATADFYTRVLGFSVTSDRRDDDDAYLALERGAVRIGAASRAEPGYHEHHFRILDPGGYYLRVTEAMESA